MPFRLRVVLIALRRDRLEGNSVNRDPKNTTMGQCRLIRSERFDNYLELSLLRPNCVWIPTRVKFSRLMVGNAIALDNLVLSFHVDFGHWLRKLDCLHPLRSYFRTARTLSLVVPMTLLSEELCSVRSS
mgnify:CR=1 FL=1